MAYILKEVVNDEIGWPFVINREELERRLSKIIEQDETGEGDFGFDSAIRMLIYGK